MWNSEYKSLFVSEERVKALLSLEDLFPALKQALIDFSAGAVVQPVRTILIAPGQAGALGAMPAIYGDVMGTKLVRVFPANADRGLDTHLATILLFRTDTGEELAVMDGRIITAWRTAVVSAIATDALAKEDVRVLAILGSGVQARTHVAALQRVRRFEEVRVWSRTDEHARRFAAEIGAKCMSTVEQAVRGAHVVVTVSNASEPILRGAWLEEAAHVNAVGAIGMEKRELDEDVFRGATVVVESREAALKESAEIVKSGAEIYAELGEVLSGNVKTPESGRTVYKSLGIAVEDIAAARVVYERAIAEAATSDGRQA